MMNTNSFKQCLSSVFDTVIVFTNKPITFRFPMVGTFYIFCTKPKSIFTWIIGVIHRTYATRHDGIVIKIPIPSIFLCLNPCLDIIRFTIWAWKKKWCVFVSITSFYIINPRIRCNLFICCLFYTKQMYNNSYRSAIKHDIEKKPFLTANLIIVYFNKTLCLFNALNICLWWAFD